MKISRVTSQFPCDCKTVWDIVTDNENFEWRSDLSKIEIIDENRFDEYTRDKFVTHFRITAKEPYREYRFDMENQNMRGHWSGIFESCDDGTQITFTEQVQVKNPIMNLFVKGYLKKQQVGYIADLRKAGDGNAAEKSGGDDKMRNPEQTIGNLIDKQKVSFIASISAEGFPNMKAMLPPRKRVGIKEFWFTTNTSSMRVAQYRENPNASIYFYDKRFFRGVMLIGTMEVLEDAEAKQMIWLEGDTMYYPQGVTDPDYCVLKFTAEKGRYYSNFKSEDFDVLPMSI